MRRVLAALALSGLLAACAGTPLPVAPDEERVGDFLTVTGALAYSERIALPPGSIVRVSFSEVTADDGPAVLLAEQVTVLDGAQVPVPFSVSVDMALLDPARRYGVEGTVGDPAGDLRWATATTPVAKADGATADLGTLALVRVVPPGPVSAANVDFACGSDVVRARFFDDRVFVELADAVHELPRVPSGSGARYALNADGGRIAFWEKGGEALLDRGGVAESCAPLVPRKTARR